MTTPLKYSLAVFLTSSLLAVGQGKKNENFIEGQFFNLTNTEETPTGGWCWFQGERTVVDARHPDGPMLLASTVSFSETKGDPVAGDVNLLWRNLKTGEQGVFELHDRLQQDDHNSAGLWLRPDGRYLAVYSRHSTDTASRYRISEAHDPTQWSEEKIMRKGEKGGRVCYSNIYAIGEGKDQIVLNFRRGHNYNQNVWISEDSGENWFRGGLVLKEGKGHQRPYARYYGDGKEVHFVTTDGHPRNVDTGLWHGKVSRSADKKLQLLDSAGVGVDPDLQDDEAKAVSELTEIIAPGEVLDGVKVNRAWPCDLSLTPDGRLQVIMSVRVENSDKDHRYVYAYYDGKTWHKEILAAAGSYMYKRENDYTGLGAIHPRKFGEVVISTDIDPRNEKATEFHEIYRGKRDENGSWAWAALTENSTMQNLRPEIPDWEATHTVVLWLRGTYRSYTNQDVQTYGTLLKW